MITEELETMLWNIAQTLESLNDRLSRVEKILWATTTIDKEFQDKFRKESEDFRKLAESYVGIKRGDHYE